MAYGVITTTAITSGKRIEIELNDLASELGYDKASFYSDDITGVSHETGDAGVLVRLIDGRKFVLTYEFVSNSHTIKVDSIDATTITSNTQMYDLVKAFR